MKWDNFAPSDLNLMLKKGGPRIFFVTGRAHFFDINFMGHVFQKSSLKNNPIKNGIAFLAIPTYKVDNKNLISKK